MTRSSEHFPVSSEQPPHQSRGRDKNKRYYSYYKVWGYVQGGFFMGLYYVALLLCIGALSWILWEGRSLAESAENMIDNMEIIVGIVLGLFSVLATFVVVFFALRIETMAINKVNLVAQAIMEKKFDGKEGLIATTLEHALNSNQNEDEPNLNMKNRNFNSNSHGFSNSYIEILLLLFVLAFALFLIWSASDFSFWAASYKLSTQGLAALVVGALGILIAFTIVLFALRATRLSQIAGQIESYSTIEKLAPLYNHLYHDLLSNFLKLLRLARIPYTYLHGLNRIDLIKSEILGEDLNIAKRERFNQKKKCEESLLHFFIFAVISVVLILGYFLFFMGNTGSIESIIILIITLFSFLITLIVIFFSGRVVLSAIASSEMQAINVSRSELKYEEELLHRRINSLRKLQRTLTTLPKPGYLAQADKLDTIIADTLMHLQDLQIFGSKGRHGSSQNKQFVQVHGHIRKLWLSWAKYLRGELDKTKIKIPEKGEINKIFINARRADSEVMIRVREYLINNRENYSRRFICQICFKEFEGRHHGTPELENLKNNRRQARSVMDNIIKTVQCGFLIAQLRAAVSVLDHFNTEQTTGDEIEGTNYREYVTLFGELNPDSIDLDMAGSEPIISSELLKRAIQF